jgi:hypothetical protein
MPVRSSRQTLKGPAKFPGNNLYIDRVTKISSAATLLNAVGRCHIDAFVLHFVQHVAD